MKMRADLSKKKKPRMFVTELAHRMRVPYFTLHRILKGRIQGSIIAWEKIAAYYQFEESRNSR
jgi:hypothetical protein